LKRAGAILGTILAAFSLVVAPAHATHPVRHYLPPLWVTGYDLRGLTASGVPAGPGICAADPRYISRGVYLTIPHKTKRCRVMDTGVVGWSADIWFSTAAECYRVTGESYGAYWESH
jgi:3D (Asp-Asp-Asp) domain-containing protein